MSKAALVIDMPESCIRCRLGQNKSNPAELAIKCAVCGNWAIGIEVDKRPDWCPLVPLPEKAHHPDWCDGGNR